MSIGLRTILIVTAIFFVAFVVRKLKKNQIRKMVTLFWLFLSVILFVLGVFPNIAMFIANYIGVESTANFVFLVVIFVLMIRSFLLDIRVAKLEIRLSELVQVIALKEYCREEKDDEIGQKLNEL